MVVQMISFPQIPYRLLPSEIFVTNKCVKSIFAFNCSGIHVSNVVVMEQRGDARKSIPLSEGTPISSLIQLIKYY